MRKLLQKLNKNPYKKPILLLDQMMVSGSNFLLGILLVRSLGLESYGVFALLWMIVLFALGINQALITKPMLSLAPKMNKEDSTEYLVNIYWLQSALSTLLLFAGIGTWFTADFFNFDIAHLSFIPVVSLILFLQLFHDYFRKKCFIEDNVFLAFILDGILYMGQLILIGYFWLTGGLSLYTALLCILVVNAVGIGMMWLINGFSIPNFTSLRSTWKKQFHYSKWLVGTSVLQWFSGNYFIIIGATIIGPVAVGALRMVQNIMGFFHILFLSMENIVPIEAARQLQAGGWNSMTLYLKKMTTKLGLVFLVLLVAVAGLSPLIIELLYGTEYLEYSYVVVVYCAMYIMVFLSLPLQFALRTIELTYPLFVAYIIATIFSFFAASFFLKEWGMSGLLAGLVITQFITFATYGYYYLNYGKSNYSRQEIALYKK